MLGTKQKSPADVLDYDISFAAWIATGDTITTVTTEVIPQGQLAVDSVQVSSPIVKTWVSGGEDGSTYEIKVTTSTQGGRVKEESFKIRVKEV